MSREARWARQLAELRALRAAVLAEAEPVRREREELLAELGPALARLRALEARLKAIEQPALGKLDNQIGVLTRLMAGAGRRPAGGGNG